MELWDVYDQQRQKTGASMARGEAPPPGGYHLVVHICLFNARGALLIQKRQMEKSAWPGLWDLSCGGSALLGETSGEAASRELFEELGIRIDFRALRPRLTMNFPRGFDDVYLQPWEGDPAGLRLQAEEVADARWATREEVLGLIETGEFLPYLPSFIELLFALRDKQDALGG